MLFEKPENTVSARREEEILKYWEKEDIFQKSMKNREGGKRFVFFEGRYFFPRGVPVVEVTNAIASEEVAGKVAPLLRDYPLVIVRGHGTFAVGNSLEDGFHYTSSLEHSARIASAYRVNSNSR